MRAEAWDIIKVGDIITFYSTGYKPDGSWSDKKFLQSAIVSEVRENSVSAKKPGQKSWDYIHKDEIEDHYMLILKFSDEIEDNWSKQFGE